MAADLPQCAEVCGITVRPVMQGKCLCGDVAFELENCVPKLYQCHCSLCRKQGGSASNTATIINAENFRWTSGSDKISSFVTSTGFRSDFCVKCGSPVPNPLRNTSYFWVPAGLLENDGKLEIVAHLHVGSKASWDIIGSTGTQFDTMPEFAALLHVLHEPPPSLPQGE